MNRKHRRQVARRSSVASAPAAPEPQLRLSEPLIEAIKHLKAGAYDEARELLEHVVEAEPGNWQGLHLLGLIAYRQGRLPNAAGLIRRCLSINPNLAEAYSDLGVVLKDMGELDDAQIACEKAISLKPDFHPAHSNLGNIFKALGELQDAADCYRRAIELAPNFVDAHANLSTALVMLGETEEGLISAQRAVDLAPNHVEALLAYGHALRTAGIFGEAMAAYRRVIELRPTFGPVYSDLGCVLQENGHVEGALDLHQRAIALNPEYAEAYNNLGIALKYLGRNDDALRAYENAIRLKPDYAEAYSNLGVVFDACGQHRDAAAAYRKAIEIDPKLLHPYVNLAGTLWEQNNLADAIAAHAKALTIDPLHPTALVEYYNLRRHACDWDGIASSEEKILSQTYRNGKRVAPFPILNIDCGPEDHLLCAREWTEGLPRGMTAPFAYMPPRSASMEGKLRIGYMSADFNNHATANLIAELIERHDRSRFEVFGYCFSYEDGSDLRRRLGHAFDRFVLIDKLSHADAAHRIHADGIDILIDLKGYTAHSRAEILACRPAPIQVNYLGFPATMGADFMDYIIADDFILPMDQQPFYDEKIVHLPGCYQPNDSKRPISPERQTRAEYGLPEDAFVFCCFNNTYKITPQLFAIWIRLLQAVPGSVLWLLEANSLVRENLQRKAMSSGVDPARLIFAPKTNLARHLARHRLADLFLDTLPVNAHTTASDALWAGLPVLTCAGETFVARVCGSLLNAVDLKELITHSLEEYETVALGLARERAKLKALRERLDRNRANAPLFDIARYTKGLEAAFEHMAEIRADGHAPRAFAVTLAEEPDEQPEPAKTEWTAVDGDPAASEGRQTDARIAYQACPLCQSSKIAAHREADATTHPRYSFLLPQSVTWCRCSDCGHTFAEGYLTPELAEIALAEPSPDQIVGHDAEARRTIAGRIVASVAEFQAEGDWLDVQFGDASLLLTAEEWGFRPVGLETRRRNFDALEPLGYEVYPASIETLAGFAGRFEVVSLAGVLEKIAHPPQALDAAYRLLKPGGALFISMPNMATVSWRLMEQSGDNPYWSHPEHYHAFTRDRLYSLLVKHRFDVATYQVSERCRSGMDVIALKA